MFFTILIFSVSLIAMIAMVMLKMYELKIGQRSLILKFISRKFDPITGSMIGFYNNMSVSYFSKLFGLLGAKFGIITANFLFYLKNKFSKIAANLYHHSRKLEANSTNQPSFFIKTIKEYKDNLQNSREKDDHKK